jgi:uncharacterized membrane protein
VSKHAAPRFLRRWIMPVRVVRARPFLFGAAVVGALVGAITPSAWTVTARCLAGWDAAILVYFALIARMMMRADHASMRRRAQELDEGQVVILAVSILAAMISFGAIVAELGAGKDFAGAAKAIHVGFAIVTIVLSWFFIHLMFTLHYANEFYFEFDADGDGVPDLRGGLHFPGTTQPAYVDFLYYAFTIGVAAQTADVETTSAAMRTFTLVQSIVAFFYNTAILALAINIAAGLL